MRGLPSTKRTGGSWVALAATLALTSLVSGCALLGSGSKTAKDATVASQLSSSATSLAFGNVTMGTSGHQSFTLTNPGTATITISTASTTSPAFAVSGISLPAALAAGAKLSINVTFTPASMGSASASLNLDSNATNASISIPMTADVVAPAPQITVNPAAAAFGNVNVGGSTSQTITISNSGGATLAISLAIVGGSSAFTTSGLTTPVIINANSSSTFSVKFAPTTAGAATGNITLTSNATGSPTAIDLTGTGVAASQAQLALNPTDAAFGNVNVGSSATLPIAVSNPGTATLTISQIAVSGAGFSDSGLTTPVTVNAGSSTILNVKFAPTTPGPASGSISLTSNASSSPNTLPLSGTGLAPQISLSPSPVAFGTVTDGSSSSKTVTISNAGNATLAITNASISGTGFTLSGLTTPLNIAAGGTSTFSVTFAATGTTAVTGTVTLTSNAAGSPTALSLTATGAGAPTPQISVTPASVAFGNVVEGTTNSQTITVKNTGNATLTITAATPSGTGYTVSGLSLPLNVAANASSTFNVNFAPTGTTAVSGSVSLVSNVATSPTAIPLTGTGVAATLVLGVSSNSVNFGNVNDGSTGSQTVTLTNSGNSNLTISKLALTGTGFGSSGVTPPQTLTPGQKVTLTLTFVPTGATTSSGTVTITSNATTSPSTISVTGTGVVVVQHSASLGWAASTSTGVTGYNIYRSTTSGTGYVKINTTQIQGLAYTDSTVNGTTTYYYVATSVNSNGAESGFSNMATANIP